MRKSYMFKLMGRGAGTAVMLKVMEGVIGASAMFNEMRE